MKTNVWKQDSDYVAIVADLLAQPAVQRLADFTQHHHSNRLDHSIAVSYDSYLLAKKWHLNTTAVARAGLLHDLFYYDWRETKFDLGSHAFIHPRVALRNAEKLTKLTPMEKDIILKHIFVATLALPKYRESFLFSLVDYYEAENEFFGPLRTKVAKQLDRFRGKISAG